MGNNRYDVIELKDAVPGNLIWYFHIDLLYEVN